MPIYEFYCPDCHMVFNFFARSMHTDRQPDCPKCGRKELGRQISRFAALKGGGSDADEQSDLPFDEAKMEQAMAALAGEAENINEDDPKAAAQLMRKMTEMTGMRFNDSMEEAIARMEAGEDPEQIEQEMGDMLDGDDDPFLPVNKAKAHLFRPPVHDETLYDL